MAVVFVAYIFSAVNAAARAIIAGFSFGMSLPFAGLYLDHGRNWGRNGRDKTLN